MTYEIEKQDIDLIPDSFVVFMESAFLYLALILIFFILMAFLKKFVRHQLRKGLYFEHSIYSVRLSKEKSDDKRGEYTVQELHEEISRGETIFSSIGGLRAQRGWRTMLFGRNDHFSFEVVANKSKIVFYVVAPVGMERYIEQQIHAHYPEAVFEKTEDYNMFHHDSKIVAGSLKTTKKFIFPIKTYLKMETDPMNSILNVMSKLDDDEAVAIQYVVRSSRAGWHKTGSDIVRKVHKGNKISEVISPNYIGKVISFLGGLFSLATGDKNKPLDEPLNRLTAMEEEMLKGIEEKNSKAGLDVNLRIIVSAKNKGKAKTYLDNLVSAYGQYNFYEYGNSFRNKIKTRGQKKIINNFIYRSYSDRINFLLNTEELASLYHFPLRNAETPNILWLTAKHAPAPADLPVRGITLGKNVYRNVERDIKVSREDRRRHMYVIGKSGGGKSQFIAGMAIQDIINGEGVCVLDPHGDLIEDILERIPPERAEDVILFSPSDNERPMALNLVEFDARYPEQKTFVINELINIFDKLYDLKATGGPIFEQYMRNALLLIMSDPESGSTLMEIPKVLSDPEFRKMKLEKCGDPTVVEFWKKEAEKAGGDAALANVVPYITSKLTQFISNDTMRPIIGQQDSSFNLRDVMDKQKILLIDLSKGAIGEMNAFLLGMILIGKILMSALSRTDMPEEKRKDFYLYIDEFQNFTTDSICSILSEARKYGLNLIIAHQYLGQLNSGQDTSIQDAVFGNVGTWVLFKVGSDDAEIMEKEFAPVFSSYDLINIEKYTTYTKLLIDNTASRPFSMKTLWPLPGVVNKGVAEKIKTLSRLKYGQDRNMIEAEIRKRTKI